MTASVHLAIMLRQAGSQGIIFQSVAIDSDDNLIVYFANCEAGALQIQNENEFLRKAENIAAKRR